VISGPQGLAGYLKDHERQFQRTLCTKLLGYALGRSELFSDRVLIEQMLSDARSGDGRFSNLVDKVVTSRQFRYYRVEDDGRGQKPDSISARPEVQDHVER
jgi:hypothetical protein